MRHECLRGDPLSEVQCGNVAMIHDRRDRLLLTHLKTFCRDNERKPSTRDGDNLSERSTSKHPNTMNSGRTTVQTPDYGSDGSSSRFSTALSRLKYNDYKPLMRTFTRRFESPPKVNILRFCTQFKCLLFTGRFLL